LVRGGGLSPCFDRRNDIELPLAMVSVLLLPWSLSLAWKKHQVPNKLAFRDWRIGDFAVWGGKLRGTQAAIDMLLPLDAVAFGLTGIGIVFLVCARNAS
jgi:hypothetical protein